MVGFPLVKDGEISVITKAVEDILNAVDGLLIILGFTVQLTIVNT